MLSCGSPGSPSILILKFATVPDPAVGGLPTPSFGLDLDLRTCTEPVALRKFPLSDSLWTSEYGLLFHPTPRPPSLVRFVLPRVGSGLTSPPQTESQ